MSRLMDTYTNISTILKGLSNKIQIAEKKMDDINHKRDNEIPDRISSLEEQLKKIDEYKLKIKGFRLLAEKNLESKNVLTIEAPPGYRVNMNRLRNWAMMIDPMVTNDPYAQRVYVVAKCDEYFLDQKKKEFTARIEELRNDLETGNTGELERLAQEIQQFKSRLSEYALSSEINNFAKDVIAANEIYQFDGSPTEYHPGGSEENVVTPGAIGFPIVFNEEAQNHLKELMGKYYDEKGKRVYLPFEEINADNEFAITVSCIPFRKRLNEMDAGIRNLILNVIDKSVAGSRKVYVIDAERQNSAVVGTLKQLEGTFALEHVPRNQEQISATLEQIVSTFSDFDDVLESCDSVIEYNKSVAAGQRLERAVIVLIGWPNAFNGKSAEYVSRIITNYERYGISFIAVSIKNNMKDNNDFGLSEYLTENVIHINMTGTDTTLAYGNGPERKFAWYTFKETLEASYANSLRKQQIENDRIGNEYVKRYSLDNIPPYTREYKKIELPFGIDSKDNPQSVSFENENFAAYLVGASRSGKSTLLHTLIAGIIRNYHPDNVELWLADFKQLEFEKYIKHLPPHVKYVLLDESAELIYDLIDKLTDKMIERQHIFAREGKEKIDQIDPIKLGEPMPIIFVILDEFSIMSQAIAESPTYKLRLQNLLAKGAALGIKFLFSSQTFTTGVAGLTATARAQIQQRISMKGTKEEISETLELSANLKTEQVRNWIDALPPHYALVKYRQGADVPPQVKRVLVMYFKDYGIRDNMIEKLNSQMKAVERFSPGEIETYVEKHPVCVDGRTYYAFNETNLKNGIARLKAEEPDKYMGDEVFILLGVPRLMVKEKWIAITKETRENMLLVGSSTEQACCASVITSVMKSFISQGKKVQIWAYSKNRLYRTYKDYAWNTSDYECVDFVEDIDNICMAIRDLKEKITDREINDELIVLIGLDRICSDFEYMDANVGHRGLLSDIQTDSISQQKQMESELFNSGAIAKTNEEKAQVERYQEFVRISNEIIERGEELGKSEDEIETEIDKTREEFFKDFSLENTSSSEVQAEEYTDLEDLASLEESYEDEMPLMGAYDATEDFNYIVKQGSRLGYHFILHLNSYADIKLTHLKNDYFRHRMAFQISKEDSYELFSNAIATGLPEHVCQYYDLLETYSFRPYMHKGIVWDGWEVSETGNAYSPFDNGE